MSLVSLYVNLSSWSFACGIVLSYGSCSCQICVPALPLCMKYSSVSVSCLFTLDCVRSRVIWFLSRLSRGEVAGPGAETEPSVNACESFVLLTQHRTSCKTKTATNNNQTEHKDTKNTTGLNNVPP